MKHLFITGFALLLASCASNKIVESSTAAKEIEDKYSNRVGSATKQDLVQEFGPANWCRQQPTGEETCRFYKKTGVKWMGEKTDRVHRETFDEVTADFDANGVLKTFKTTAQK